MSQQHKVGVLGLGKMGSAICGNLISKGFEVHYYNRTLEKGNQFKEKGAIPHSSPKDLGSSVDIAITSLKDDQAVNEVISGEEGLLKGLKSGSLWIDASTINPDTSGKHAEECSKRGIERLDMPVVGSPDRGLSGKLILLIGGSKEVFTKTEGFLSQLGTPIFLGTDGNGHKMKLLINLYLGTISLAVAEGTVLAQKMGFESMAFIETLNKTSHKNGYTEVKGVKVARGEFGATFTLDNMLKDIKLADAQARKSGAVLPVASVAAQLFTEASNVGLGSKDFSAIALEIRRISGLPTSDHS